MAGATDGEARLTVRGGARPKRTASRANDWTNQMAETFVETIANSCNVTLAAKAIGRSLTCVYRRKARDASFRNNWEEAMAIGSSRLEMMLLERALHGIEKVVVARDGTSSTMREYSDRTALTLMRMHRDGVAKSAAPVDALEVGEARDRIPARIQRLRARKSGRVETKGMASCEAMLRRIGRAGRAWA